jgi:protein TonB
MRLSNEGRVWVFAIAASTFIHGAVFVFVPAAHLTAPEPVMDVRIVTEERKHTEMSLVNDNSSHASRAKPEVPVERVAQSKKDHSKKTAPAPVAALNTPPAASNSSFKKTENGPGNGGPFPAADIAAGNDGGQGGQGGGALDQGHETDHLRQGDASGGGALVEAESLRITKRVVPEYPVFSRKRREEGTVSVIMTIVRGSVEKAEIERSSGYERLDASALRAARQWRFDTGDTTVLRARVSFSFKLSGN